ncbi:MAG: BON domain-containing protein [Terriglobales bacterium]
MKPRVGIYVWIVLLMGILAVGIACTKAAGDSELTGEVQSRLNADSGLQGKQLTVQTSGGVVTLSGTVDNEAQRTAASRYASSVPGIKEVVNNLQVAPADGTMSSEQPAPAEPARPAAKPRPSAPRQRRAPSSPTMAAAPPAPAMAPVQDSHPAPVMAAAPAAPAVPPAPKKVSIPSGTTLAIRLVDEIDSETAQPGQTFKATLDSPLSIDGDVVVPAGYDVHGHVIDVKSAGKFAGRSELVLQLDRIMVGGKSYGIQTDQYRRGGSSRGKNTAAKVGTGAAIGAIIGGIAGGGKGAAIGAAAGGGIGGGVQAATKGQQIKLPTETVLNFTLQSSLTVTPVSEGPNSNRQKLETPQ